MYFDVDVPIPPVPFVSVASDTVCKYQTVQLNAGTVPLSANSRYTWSPSIGLNNPNISNPVLTADSSRWYKVAISSPNSCAPTVYDSVFIYVKSFSLPNAFAGSNQTICKGDSATLTAASGYTYQWLPGGSLDSTITVSPIVTTDYIIFITDTNGCGNSDTVKVIVNQNPIINAGVDRTVCAGTFIILTATGGSTYLWNTGVATNNLAVSPSSSLTYSVIGTALNGCTSTDSVFVKVNPLPQASAGIDQSVCKGSSATLTATGGSTYLWTPTSSTSSSITVTPFATSNYVVLVTDSLGCQKRDTVRVIVLPLPFANAGLDQTICVGSTATLAATGGSTYQWSPGNLVGDTINVNPISTTGYQVTVTDSLGCQKIDSVKVFVNALPALELGSNVSICDGDTLTINSPVTAAIYLWMPGSITSSTFTISPTDTSQIVLMISDGNGCQNSDSIQVLVNPLPLVDAGNDVKICSGFPTTLQGNGGVGYLWNPGNLTTSAINVAPNSSTLYFLTVTDNNGCVANDSVNIFVDPYISGTSYEDTICVGSSILLSDTGGVSYLWSYNNSTNDTIVVSPSTSTSYYVNIVTPVGCLIYDTMNVYVNQLPLANAGATKTICIGDSTTLQATGGLYYNWNVPNGNSSVVAVKPVTTSSFIVEVTDVNGCKNSDTVLVAVNALPIANAGLDQTICAGDSTTLIASGGINYTWNVPGSSGSTVVVAPINSDKFIVLVEDANGCFNKDSVNVFVNNLPVASYTINPNNCEDTPILFTNTSYSVSSTIVKNNWDFGDGNISNLLNPSNTFVEAKDYDVSLTVTDLLGCENKISNKITINYLPLPDFVATNACVNEEISFKDLSVVNSGKITNWMWDFGDGRSSLLTNPTHEYLQHGVYDVALKVTTDSACATTLKKIQYVEIYPLPEADFNATPSITSILEPKVQFIDVSNGGSIWSWDFGDLKGFSSNQNPFYFYNDTGYFNVSLILENTYGCLDTAYREIYIAPGFTIYIPTAFTPNGDEKNDYFIPSGMGIASLDMRIFDRFGAEIFSTSDLNAPWNGSVRNTEQLCSEGVYAYYMKIRDYKGLVTEYSGVVSLVR
jgi:gliding motility-associated-like protein